MILKVENGTFFYNEKDRAVLKNINFSAESGDIVAILGHNGVGKTTLLRCMMGLLKWTEGGCSLDGTDIRSIPSKKLWSEVSYVPQAKQASAAYTVEEMILLGRSSEMGLFSMPGEKDLKKTEELLGTFYLMDKRHKKCSEISGGELQMVLIARAMASEPKVLILDEPESNLDFKNQLLVLETMTALAAQGVTCIFNTHYPAHALRRANKAMLLTGDGDYLFGTTREVVTEENIERAFGVSAVIGDIETPWNIYQDVIPIARNKGEGVNQSRSKLNSVEQTGAASRSSGPTLESGVRKGEESESSSPKFDHSELAGAAAQSSRPDFFMDRSDKDDRVIAMLSIIFNETTASEKINTLLHESSQYIIGRMGMPYKSAGIFIISITLDTERKNVQTLTDRLNLLQGVSVKATYAKEVRAEK